MCSTLWERLHTEVSKLYAHPILMRMKLGKISVQHHTSLCIHAWSFIIQCITNKMCMHNLLWGCAEIFPETFPNILKKINP